MASGNTRDEAIASAIFEVIERDAMNLAMANNNPPRCQVGSSRDPFTNEAIFKIHSAGCELFVYDCRSDVGIPCFLSIVADRNKGVGLFKGYGCHLSPDVALNRSICEAAQARCVVLSGTRDDVTWAAHRGVLRHTEDFDWVKRLNRDPFSTDVKDMADLSTGTTSGDIDKALALLQGAGFGRVLVVDFPIEDALGPDETPSSAPFSCVKVLIPGMAGYKYLSGMTSGRVLGGRPS
jgi:ribosomal protein S12 methylthiotransferase accessory factor